MRALLLVILVAGSGIIGSGCARSRDVLRPLPAGAAPVEYALTIPAGYDVRSAEFGAAYAPSVSGGEGLPVVGSSAQNAYVTVFATERATGTDVLLVYGDIHRRSDPVAIIRLRPAIR